MNHYSQNEPFYGMSISAVPFNFQLPLIIRNYILQKTLFLFFDTSRFCKFEQYAYYIFIWPDYLLRRLNRSCSRPYGVVHLHAQPSKRAAIANILPKWQYEQYCVSCIQSI